ncbi:hypothetical protein CSA80_03670 [Candidatus Saccharibacteria bacterium]|nr:MAG: hypothetical protein CSA80_03670 [Candidatus Saccharibacteria bacterium]
MFFQRVKYIGVALCMLIITTLSMAPPAVAVEDCPSGMSDLDCQALKFGWEDWVPDSANSCGESSAGSVVTSSDFQKNLEQAYNYFLSKKDANGNPILTDIQAAAIIGNIARESTGDPQNTQTKFTPDRTKDPNEVTPANGGWGLIQWTPARKVIRAAEDAGITGPIYELQTQLDLVWWHMNNRSPTAHMNMLAGFTQTDLMEAVKYYEITMEGAGDKAYTERFKAAQIALKYPKTGNTTISASTGCECVSDDSLLRGSAGKVVLDPGHSGIDKQGAEKDSETGLYIGDSSNPTERKQVWEVAQKVKKTLEEKGYTVIMTKKSEKDYVNLKQRALIANKANAAIAVSIHNTPGKFGGSSSWVSPQKVGNYRTNENGKKTVFEDKALAQKSQAYAQAMVAARKAAGEPGAKIHDIVFDGRPGLSAGNLPVVQLLSKVPWIYNEVGQTGFNTDIYAKGIADGIMRAVRPAKDASRSNSEGCSGAAAGDAVQTALNYAWPTYTSPPYTKLKPSYESAVKSALKEGGRYVGTLAKPGVDCGGFVTLVMRDSGVDPKYGGGGNVERQHEHIQKSGLYRKIDVETTADLQPGDIAISKGEGHTFIYVGPGQTGSNADGSPAEFATAVASASIGGRGGRSWRSPMAGRENPLTADHIYRYIGGSNE